MVTASAGPHKVTAAPVTVPQTGITSQVFAATVKEQTACVKAGATTTVNVTYALVPTSGKLWAGVSNAPGGATMLGFAPASVAATGIASADVVANTGGSDGFTFDKDGNMWVLGGTTADSPVARYPASVFASDGEKTPDITIDSPSFGDSIPGAKALAFDGSGNLWVAVVADGKVVMFTAAQVAAGGTPTATVERKGHRAARRGSPSTAPATSGSPRTTTPPSCASTPRHLTRRAPAADLAIMAMATTSNVTSTLRSPIGLAFDASRKPVGELRRHIASIPAADQTGTGSKTITPPVVITTDVATLPVGIAFDQDGGMWLAHAVNKIARFDATQLAVSGSVTPSIVIDSVDVGSAAWFAMYPAPAFTPLYHKVP